MDSTDPRSPHRRTWDTLPWLVAGTAGSDDAQHALDHLQGCADCRSELAFQQRIHAGLQAQRPAAGLPAPDAALQRLWARLDVADGGPPAVMPQPRPTPAWTRWLLAAVLLQAVGLGAAGLALLERSRDAADYRTLSQPPAAAAAASVRLVPGQEMDFAALRALLARTGMAVVEAAPDGSSLGLAAADGKPATSAAALPALRAAPGVRLAEPVR